jgi:6,7-dimethyl-8-ribityllumazine synthase
MNIGIVAAKFNQYITKRLLMGTLQALKEHQVLDAKIRTFWVPGAFEIPVTAAALAQSKCYSAIICLGAVIRGNTPHFDFVAGECAQGVMRVSLDYQLPVIFGVLTTDTVEQALTRSEKDNSNTGYSSTLTALEMADLFTKLR